MTPNPLDPRRIALIGFGKVGQRFGREFSATGRFAVATYDILFNDSRNSPMKNGARCSIG